MDPHVAKADVPWWRQKLFTVCGPILFLDMADRVAFYTVSGALITNLQQQFSHGAAQAVAIQSVFQVVCYSNVFLGGYLADSVLGRFKTVTLFLACFCIGTFVCAVATHPDVQSLGLYLFGVMGLIALGFGSIVPNISNFGGDQFNKADERKDSENFFYVLYMMISLGAAIAYGFLTSLATGGSAGMVFNFGIDLVPANFGYFSAYFIAAVIVTAASIMFFLFRNHYTHIQPSGNSLGAAIYYIYSGAGKCMPGTASFIGWILIVVFLALTLVDAFTTTPIPALGYTNLFLATLATGLICWGHTDNSWVDKIPDHPLGLLTREEAKGLFGVVPVILLTDVFFSFVYYTVEGPFYVQTCHMNLKAGSGQFNGTIITGINALGSLVLTPLVVHVMWPLIGWAMRKELTIRHKLVTGFACAILSMIVAAILEYARRSAGQLPQQKENLSQCAGNSEYPVYFSDIGGFYMLIPFTLMGIAGICVYPTTNFFAYDSCPPRARSVAQAFNWFALGAIPNGVRASITRAMSKFLPTSLNEPNAHVEYFYFLGMAFGIVGVPLVLYFMTLFSRHYNVSEITAPKIDESMILNVAENPSDRKDRAENEDGDKQRVRYTPYDDEVHVVSVQPECL